MVVYYRYLRYKQFITQLAEHQHNTVKPEIICHILANKLSPPELFLSYKILHPKETWRILCTNL